MLRPALGATHRPLWNSLHTNCGRLLMLLGITNVFLGVVLLHDLKGQHLVDWLVPVVACLGALAAAALLLEAFKMQMQRTHRCVWAGGGWGDASGQSRSHAARAHSFGYGIVRGWSDCCNACWQP